MSSRSNEMLQQISIVIGTRIRERRRHLGMSMQDLGEALDLAYQQVQKYEAGENRISVARLPFLARALQVPISYFTEGLLETIGRDTSPADEG